MSYQIVSNDHLLKIQNTIKKALGKKTSKTLTTTAITYEDYYGLSSSGDSTDYNQSYGSYSGYDTGGGASIYNNYSSQNTYGTYSDTGTASSAYSGQTYDTGTQNSYYNYGQ